MRWCFWLLSRSRRHRLPGAYLIWLEATMRQHIAATPEDEYPEGRSDAVGRYGRRPTQRLPAITHHITRIVPVDLRTTTMPTIVVEQEHKKGKQVDAR